MSKLFVSEHPLIHTKMAMLRDEQTGTKEFREIIGEVASLLLYEATRDLPLKEVQVKTPIATATCKTIDTKLAMVPILRAGLGMTDGLLNLLPAAKIGHIGLYRDETTLEPVEYYCKLPLDIEERTVFLTDPYAGNGRFRRCGNRLSEGKRGKKYYFPVYSGSNRGCGAFAEESSRCGYLCSGV